MSFHIEGPWLSTSGKRKGKVKFRNADEAKKARELDKEWKELQKKWGVEAENKKRTRALSAESLKYTMSVPPGRETRHIPSLNTGLAVATKAEPKVYTGTLMIGIAVLHKSCLQPIFNDQAAKDAANMRR